MSVIKKELDKIKIEQKQDEIILENQKKTFEKELWTELSEEPQKTIEIKEIKRNFWQRLKYLFTGN